MALLGALEHGIYVDNEDDDDCHGMSIAQIHEYFGLDRDASDDEKSVEEEEQSQAEIDVDVGDKNSTSDDEDWLACPSGSEDEDLEMEDLDEPVCFIILSWVYVYQNILGPFDGAV
jgi:hypothetical protein